MSRNAASTPVPLPAPITPAAASADTHARPSRHLRVSRFAALLVALDLAACAIGTGLGSYEIAQAQAGLQRAGSGSLAATTQTLHDHLAVAGTAFGVARLCWWPWRIPASVVASLPPLRAVGQVGPLLDLAADGSDAGAGALDAAHPALTALGKHEAASKTPSGDAGSRLFSGLQQAQPQLRASLTALAAVALDGRAVDTSVLPAALGHRLVTLQRDLPLGVAVLHAALAAPDLLGALHPRTYLLVPENQLDLRATGGFAGTAVLLHVSHGRLLLGASQASDAVDAARAAYVPPPLPLATYEHISNWLYRDANWSPDFPTTARLLRYFYWLGQHQHVDGVIAFDSTLVPALLGLTGPITVPQPTLPPATVTLTQANAVTQLDYYVNAAHGGTLNKAFAGLVYHAVFARLRHLPGSRLPGALGVIRTAFQQRHLLLWIPDRAVVPLLARQHWSGAIDTTRADYLYVVDTNVHYNKVNGLIREGLSYHAMVQADRSLSSTVTITYANMATAQTIPPPQNNTLYEDFVRVYVPLGSRLVAQHGLTQAWLPVRDHDKTVFSGYLRVSSRDRITVSFTYRVPPNALLDPSTYRLTVQKQPGTPAAPLHVVLDSATPMVHIGDAGGTAWGWQGSMSGDLTLTAAMRGGHARPIALAYDRGPTVIAPGTAPDPWSMLPATLPPSG